MKYYLVAGEASGDLHGSLLIKALKKRDPNPEFRFIGGDKMATEAGNEPFMHFSGMAFMGFLEVAKNLRTILGNLKKSEKDILCFEPNALILIDFPGFNLRIAEKAKKAGLRVYYYISPKIWAWNSKRALKIKKNIDHMFVIFPFEVDFYRKWGMEVDYVGNPLMDSIQDFKNQEFDKTPFANSEISKSSRPIIALLPGSRKQELEYILPTMLKIIPDFPNYDFIIAGSPSLGLDIYKKYLGEFIVPVLFNETYSLINRATLAIVTSGTAALEAALLNCPEVIVYKTSRISYEIAKKVILVRYISLVNLIMDQEIVKELIQGKCTPSNISKEAKKLLPGNLERDKMLQQYSLLQDKVGKPGASFRTANLIFEYMDHGK